MFVKLESNFQAVRSHPRVFEGSISVVSLCLSDCPIQTRISLANTIVSLQVRSIHGRHAHAYGTTKRFDDLSCLRFRFSLLDAVEEAICKTLKESPALIVANAPEDIYASTPLDSDGRPDRHYEKKWPAEQLLLLPESKWPTEKGSLQTWAEKRVLMHLEVSLESMRVEWEKHDRKAGDWNDDVDIERCARMAVNGINMHIDEVEACFSTIDEEELEQWRSGFRHHWPAPDGRGYALEAHPIAQSGAIKWIEAWEIARPWFVDPDAKPFMMNAVHRKHWFQGEYDLVYRWGHQLKIVDIKASLGNSDRSGDYVEQMRMYAYLWWSTHENERVDDLEIWYLAADSKKQIEVPSDDELKNLGDELQRLWSELREETPSIEQCPPNPCSNAIVWTRWRCIGRSTRKNTMSTV